ncbi:hypothetical protein QTP88_022029 [Uroleucon formosanum]
MDAKLDDILSSINELKTTQNKLVNAANEQGKTLKSFTKKLDDFNLKFVNLETKLSELEAGNTQLKSRFDLFEQDYVSANNIIVFNLPELNSENSENFSDMSQLKNLFSDSGLNLQIIKAHRLGKPISNRPRPLKVTLPNASDTFSCRLSRPLRVGRQVLALKRAVLVGRNGRSTVGAFQQHTAVDGICSSTLGIPVRSRDLTAVLTVLVAE